MRGAFGVGARGVGRFGAGQRHAHAALDETLGFAEQPQICSGYGQRRLHPFEAHAARLDCPVDHRAGARGLERRVHRQAEYGPGVQLELALPLGDEGNQPSVVRARADLAEPHLLALDEQFHAENAAPAQRLGDAPRHVAAALQRYRVHGVRLPAFHIVTGHLHMADGFAEVGAHGAVGAHAAHGELGDFIIEVDEALDDHAALRHAPARHRRLPGGAHVGRAVELALPLARGTHHRLDHAGIADAAIDRGLQLLQRIGEGIGRGGQTQLFGGQSADAFAVHGQPRSAGCGNDGHHTGSLQLFEHRRGDGLDFRHHQMRFFLQDEGAQSLGIGHLNRAGMVRHLLPRRVVVAVHRDGFHAQALQRDEHFLAQFARAEQHHAGGRRGKRGAKGRHVKVLHDLESAGQGIDRQRQNHHIEKERRHAVQQHQMAHMPPGDVHVRGLKGHAQHHGKIEIVPIIGHLIVGEHQRRRARRARGVVAMGVLQGEDHREKQPGQHDAASGQRQRAGVTAHRMQLHRQRSEYRTRQHQAEQQHRPASFGLQLGAALERFGRGVRHHPGGADKKQQRTGIKRPEQRNGVRQSGAEHRPQHHAQRNGRAQTRAVAECAVEGEKRIAHGA